MSKAYPKALYINTIKVNDLAISLSINGKSKNYLIYLIADVSIEQFCNYIKFNLYHSITFLASAGHSEIKQIFRQN